MNTEKKRSSMLGRFFDRILSFITSLFGKSRIGKTVAAGGRFYENSAWHGYAKENRLGRSSRLYLAVNTFFSKSRVVLFFKRLTTAILSTSVNVYAIFFTAYGVASLFVYYALMFIRQSGEYTVEVLALPAIIAILSVPFLTSSRSLTEAASGSFIVGRIVRSFLMIPEESLVTKKRIGSSVHMIISAILGLGAGALTYYVPPLTAPIAFFGLIVFLVIMSFPEAGVMIIAVIVPFLQYAEALRFLLPLLVCTTCASYLIKTASGKRVGIHSVGGILLGFFCAFMLIASAFTSGGWQTFIDGVYAVVLIAGGFFVTFNLLRNEKKLNICLKALIISFGILVCMGIGDMVYDSVAQILMRSWDGIDAMISEKIFYIAESAANFGIIACFMCPILFCRAVSKKSVSGVVISLISLAIAFAMSLVYGTYESILAICIGLLAYIMFHSKKSFASFVVVLIIVCIVISLALSFVPDRYIDRAEDTLQGFKPVSHPDADVRDEVNTDTWKMLTDGHLGGIGVGERVFEKTFYSYATESTEGTTAPANLYMQIICWSGFGGLFVFGLFFVWVFKNAVGYMLTATDKKNRRTVLALTAGISAALLLGIVTNLWSDMRMFYLFWMMTALLCGYVRLGRVRAERKLIGCVSEPDRVDYNVKFH